MMTDRRKVAIIGGGAVGTVLASAIQDAGHDLTLCMRTVPDGITLLSGDTSRRLAVRATDDVAAVGHCDWVLVVTKAHDSASVGPWLSRLANDRTVVVACQNGIGHRRNLASVAGPAEVLPAVVSIIAERVCPGVVRHHAGKKLTVADNTTGRAFRALMQGSGVEVDLEGDLDRAIWLKFLGNIAAAPVTTLTDRRMEVLREPAVEGLLRDLIAEAVSVAIAEGVNIGPADGENTLAALRGMDPAVTTSMQADRASGRSLEVEELSGALDRLAVKHRLSAPVNRTVLSLLRALPRNRG